MKRTKMILALAVLTTLGACSTETTTTQTGSTDTGMNPNTPMQTTTTTTTTTRTPVMFTPRENVEYVNLKTGKKVRVRVDTVHHYIVDVASNQPVDWLMEPGTTDTVYGRSMRVANHAIRYNSANDWMYDESIDDVDNMSSSGQNMNSGTSTSSMDNSNMNSTDNSTTTNGTTPATGPEGKMKTKTKTKEDGTTKTKTKIK